jgi:hypothetical protein
VRLEQQLFFDLLANQRMVLPLNRGEVIVHLGSVNQRERFLIGHPLIHSCRNLVLLTQ